MRAGAWRLFVKFQLGASRAVLVDAVVMKIDLVIRMNEE